MCACTETDVRESANDCTLASGEGLSSRRETFSPLYAARSVSSPGELTVVAKWSTEIIVVGFTQVGSGFSEVWQSRKKQAKKKRKYQ
jgi:hypothetical protein